MIKKERLIFDSASHPTLPNPPYPLIILASLNLMSTWSDLTWPHEYKRTSYIRTFIHTYTYNIVHHASLITFMYTKLSSHILRWYHEHQAALETIGIEYEILYVCIYVWIYMYVYICMYVCMYTYIHFCVPSVSSVLATWLSGYRLNPLT
jgi:hypothetical protein